MKITRIAQPTDATPSEDDPQAMRELALQLAQEGGYDLHDPKDAKKLIREIEMAQAIVRDHPTLMDVIRSGKNLQFVKRLLMQILLG